MKLINTIRRIVKEAEDNYYNASLKSDNLKEIEVLEEKLNDSLKLLSLYEEIEDDINKEED